MMASNPRDFYSEAAQEAKRSETYREWVRVRVRQILDRVGPEDVLGRYGVRLRHNGLRAEQFSCPFHGTDNKPSTRIYPSTDGKPGGAWCFVCKERWDAIALFRKFEQLEGSFTLVLTRMEQAFGLQTPEMPREAFGTNAQEGPISVELEQLFGACEKRLIGAKLKFNLEGYLRVGSILDRLRFQVEHGHKTQREAREVLVQVLSKIGEKERSE